MILILWNTGYLNIDTSKGYSKTINLRASLYSLGFTLTILLLQVYSLPCVRKCNPPCSWIFGYSFLNHRSLQPSSFALNQCGSFTRMFLPVRCDSATLGASKKCNKCSSESMCSFTLPFTLVFRVLILYRWTTLPFSVPNFLWYYTYPLTHWVYRLAVGWFAYNFFHVH